MPPVSGSRVLMLDGEACLPVAKALASETRQMILSLLTHNAMNVSELAQSLNLSHSTANFNIGVLQAVGLVSVEYEPGTRGSQKLCSKVYDEVRLRLPGAAAAAAEDTVVVSMPIGSYRHLEAAPTCGLASETKIIGMLDDPRSFHEPEHVHAQLLWFRAGYVEYVFPNNLPFGAAPAWLELSMEICSEAPQFDPNWPSDITLWINDQEIGTWTSPGDFGGEPALLTPRWWPASQTTRGLLKQWKVTEAGTMIDGTLLSTTTLASLSLDASNHIKLRIGVKPDARHKGGLNLFGRKFGNYPQDIVMRIGYDFPANAPRVTIR
jgi:predicted transcriptional regulator